MQAALTELLRKNVRVPGSGKALSEEAAVTARAQRCLTKHQLPRWELSRPLCVVGDPLGQPFTPNHRVHMVWRACGDISKINAYLIYYVRLSQLL